MKLSILFFTVACALAQASLPAPYDWESPTYVFGYKRLDQAHIVGADDFTLGTAQAFHRTVLYAPEDAYDLKDRFIMGLGYRFGIDFPLFPSLTVYLRERLVLYGYGDSPEQSSCPLIKNRLSVGIEWQLGSRWRVRLPLHLTQKRYYSSPGLAEGWWRHWLWTAPSLIYSLSKQVDMALSFETESLLATNSFSEGLTEVEMRIRL